MSQILTSDKTKKLKRLFGYGIGDFGLNIYWQTVSMFLVYWYTQIAGLDPRIAGFIFFLGMAWDAISDPIVATLTERVTTKMGTYRPFLLFGSAITACAFVLLFWVPSVEGPSKIIFLICTCLIFRTSYTIVGIPYSAMASRITYDSTERAEYSGARMFFAFLALVIVSMWLWPSVEYFGQKTGSEAQAFQITAAIGGAVATLALWLCFSMTREKPLPAKSVKSEKVWRGIWLSLTSNQALRVLLPIIMLSTAASSTLAITLIFYIEANAAIFASKEVLFTSFAVAMLIMVPIWTWLIKIWGRKKIWIFAALGYLVVSMHMMFGTQIIIAGVPIHIMLFMALSSAHAVIFWALIPDCVEFGQLESGIRSEASVYGTVLITQKMTGGLVGLTIGFVLASFGFTQDVKSSPSLIDDLNTFIAIFPTLLILLSIVPMLLLSMTRNKHDKIIEQLE